MRLGAPDLKEALARNQRAGTSLARYIPEIVYNLYRAEIELDAAEATDRREYKKVCTCIRELSAAGGTQEALQLIDKLAGTAARHAR